MVQVCSRCQRASPEMAAYCYFDGAELRSNQDGSAYRMPSAFVFPSGRRCLTYDEFAQACQDEWAEARGLLQRGVFGQFFGSCGRADLVRAAEDANTQDNPDMALSTFLNALPGVRSQTPHLDINPRRFLLGKLLAGETRELQLTILNAGQGTLQGTITVSEGQGWVSLDSKGVHELPVNAPRQQTVKLLLDTSGLAAGQSHAAKLTVVSNGGVVEVPLRLDLVARPFPKPPFQGARTQRELAEKMRSQPKAAVPLLESGEVRRWFALNGWTYPVQGPEIKGVAAVQQFFEALGLSKPPVVQVSQPEVRLRCQYPDSSRFQLTLSTPAKKWVYAQVRSEQPWLRATSPFVSGPQQANLLLEVDSSQINGDSPNVEGKAEIVANGGQVLTVRVLLEVQGLPVSKPSTPAPDLYTPRRRPMPTGSLLAALLTLPLLLLVLRLLLVPIVDGGLRSAIVEDAAARLDVALTPDSPLRQLGGWLQLPWPAILVGGTEGAIPGELFQPGRTEPVSAAEFRHYFASYFIRALVLWTWWLGGVLGAVIVWRRGTSQDALWGLVAGAMAGLVASATLASFFLVVETVPHTLWYVLSRGGSGVLPWLIWVILAVLSWAVVGVLLALPLALVPPLRRLCLEPLQRGLASLCRLLGLHELADFWTPA